MSPLCGRKSDIRFSRTVDRRICSRSKPVSGGSREAEVEVVAVVVLY